MESRSGESRCDERVSSFGGTYGKYDPAPSAVKRVTPSSTTSSSELDSYYDAIEAQIEKEYKEKMAALQLLRNSTQR